MDCRRLRRAITLPASETFGNYPINTLYGPQFVNLNAAIMKTFSITERTKFILRMDAANVLNHTNLGMPNNDVTSPSAGQIYEYRF